MPCSLV